MNGSRVRQVLPPARDFFLLPDPCRPYHQDVFSAASLPAQGTGELQSAASGFHAIETARYGVGLADDKRSSSETISGR